MSALEARLVLQHHEEVLPVLPRIASSGERSGINKWQTDGSRVVIIIVGWRTPVILRSQQRFQWLEVDVGLVLVLVRVGENVDGLVLCFLLTSPHDLNKKSNILTGGVMEVDRALGVKSSSKAPRRWMCWWKLGIRGVRACMSCCTKAGSYA
jgi:hypothetical protein